MLSNIEIIQMSGEDSRGMLTSSIMKEFNEILIANNIGFSIQDPIYLQSLYFIDRNPSNKNFVQILFSGPLNAGHWISIYYDGEIIHVYDSLGHGLNKEHKIFINRLLPDYKNLVIVNEKTQKQNHPYNCGLFAIANIVSVIFGLCPCKVRYEENDMRSHLMKIINTRTISMFTPEVTYKHLS